MYFCLQYLHQHLMTIVVSFGISFDLSVIALFLEALAFIGYQGTPKGTRYTIIGVSANFLVLGTIALIVAGVPAAIGAVSGALALVLLMCLVLLFELLF